MKHYQFSTGEESISIPLKPDVKKMYIEVTTGCNYSCITCIRHSWTDKMGDMSMEVFNKLFEDMKALPDLKCVHFGGFGEPLTHPNILEMIGKCKEIGLSVEMITNGSMLTPTVANSLVELGLDWIFVSLDGPDDDSFETIRPGASYEEVVQNIEYLQKLKKQKRTIKPELGVEFVATKTNIKKLPAMPALTDRLGAHKFIVTNVLPYHESMKDEILYDTGLDLNSFGRESTFLSMKAAPNMQLRTARHCRFVENKAMAVTWQGNISPCYAFMHTYTCYIMGRKKDMIAHSFGNVKERSLEEIWTDPAYARFRWMARTSDYPSCTDCRLLEGCSTAFNNEADCWGNNPSCSDCLWARDIVMCP
ncbi:tungsten cofactor oxidoreductase radical SAM maturase [Sporomusa malonica]|uniref:Tungsten cofactor oxidoreducase radical SAM maturase n=1 Tax=Sporomusa malonica TaxID=112901 RepID=A0A1W1ZAG4_9FIRM|nr:tungsten cofactor oxidoreductase radical SAM maturase [Sporomusa malonica]SMC45397.1 tungsten cofactor oxidoreducase radical SAM maturase [Sporomusa malonica]